MAKPIICNEKATLYIPNTEEQCEYWLIPVHSVDDISNPDRNHAWILPNGDFWVYDGTKLVQINDLSDLQVQWGNIIGNIGSQTDLVEEFKKYVKGIRLNGRDTPMNSEQIVNLLIEGGGGSGGNTFDFAIGTILETSTNDNPSLSYGGIWEQIASVDVLHVIGTKVWNGQTPQDSVPLGSTSMPMHTWQEVVQMFQDKYNFTPTSHWDMYASYNNGDGDTNPSHIEGATYLPMSQQYYVLFTASTTPGGALRVQYHYAYEVQRYKWVKTGNTEPESEGESAV